MSISNSAVEQTINKLFEDYLNSDSEDYYSIRNALAMLCKENIESFIKLTKDPDPLKRRCAFETLGSINDQAVYLTLLIGLEDKDQYVREKAILYIDKFLDFRAVEPLIKALKDPNYIVRRFAAKSLGKLSDPSIIEHLFFTAINDKDEWVKVHAASSLAKLNDRRAENLLEEITENKIYDSAVTSYARQSLFEFRKIKLVKTSDSKKVN
ncbi:MAG: HEAT repeat domain-containing protein [Blastocatellia bacterium]